MTKTIKERIEEVVKCHRPTLLPTHDEMVLYERRIITAVLTLYREMLEDRVKKMEWMKGMVSKIHLHNGDEYMLDKALKNHLLQTLIDADRKELEELTN